MLEAPTATNLMELDDALSFALILAWDDLFKGAQPCFVRIEYVCKPEQPLDHLGVWSVKSGGYQALICNYWMSPSSADPSGGVCFANGFGSDQLVQALEFIMNTQGQFTRGAVFGQSLILVYPPDEQDRTRAAPWRGVQAPNSEVHSRETLKATEAQRQDEEAYTRMDGAGYPNPHTTSMPDATGYSG